MTNTTSHNTAKYELIRSIIKEHSFGFFTISFEKKDGDIRSINGRNGVTKYLKGGVNTTKEYSNYMTVYDCHKKGYRNVNLDKVTKLVANKATYKF